MHAQSLSSVQLFVTPWTIDHEVSLSLGFSKQEYWSGLPFPSPRDLPHPGIKPTSLTSPVLAGGFFTTSSTWEVYDALKISLDTGDCLHLYQSQISVFVNILSH